MLAIHETLNESLGNLRAISNSEIKKVIETAVKKNIGKIGPDSKVIEVSSVGWKNFLKDLRKAGNERIDEKTFSLFALLIDGEVEIFVNEDPKAAIGVRTKIKNVSGRDDVTKIGDLEFFEDYEYRAVFVYEDESRQEVRSARADLKFNSERDRYHVKTYKFDDDTTYDPERGKSDFYADAMRTAKAMKRRKVHKVNLDRITASHLATIMWSEISFEVDGEVYKTWFTMQGGKPQFQTIGTNVVFNGCTRESDGKEFYITINAPKMKVELIPA